MEDQSLNSILDLDFNYKSLFADYISKVFELTRQQVAEEAKKEEVIRTL